MTRKTKAEKTAEAQLEDFKVWIVARGAEILIPTNQYEVLRYRATEGVGIIYRNEKNHLTYTGGAAGAWQAFCNGAEYRFAERAPTKTDSRKKSVLIRTLLNRDGPICFYCGETFSDDRPMTREHLVPRNAGGPDHIANQFLACAPCNCEVGHRPAVAKIKFRDLKRRGAGTMLLTDIRQAIVTLNVVEHVPTFGPLLRRIEAIIHTPKENTNVEPR
jgi:hypothetical protein